MKDSRFVMLLSLLLASTACELIAGTKSRKVGTAGTSEYDGGLGKDGAVGIEVGPPGDGPHGGEFRGAAGVTGMGGVTGAGGMDGGGGVTTAGGSPRVDAGPDLMGDTPLAGMTSDAAGGTTAGGAGGKGGVTTGGTGPGGTTTGGTTAKGGTQTGGVSGTAGAAGTRTGGAATGGGTAGTGGTGAGGVSAGGISTGGAKTGGTTVAGSSGSGGKVCVGAAICGRASTGIFCAQSNGSSSFIDGTQWSSDFSDASGWKGAPSYWATIQYADINGDGNADVCGRGPAGISCALAKATGGFSPASLWTSNDDYSDSAGWDTSPAYWSTIRFPDVTGDGKADVCARAPNGISCSVSNGVNGFGRITAWNVEFSDPLRWNSSESYWGTIQFPDLNGDGRADVCGRGVAGVYCAISNGSDGFGSVKLWASDFNDAVGFGNSPSFWGTLRFPDVDGDGKADICLRGIAGIYCAVSNGVDAFNGPTVWTPSFGDAFLMETSTSYWGTIQFPDVNGDGRADVCGRRAGGLECALSSGAAFGDSVIWAAAFNDDAGFKTDATRWGTIQFPDLNGDGKADVCGRSSTGVICGISNGTGFTTSLWTEQFGDTGVWSSLPYGATLQTPNFNTSGCLAVSGTSTLLPPARRIGPY